MLPLGAVVATPAALRFCEANRIDVLGLVRRHASGDDGDLEAEDKAANKRALVDGGRVFSSYRFGDDRVWIITEAVGDDGSRASTCVLLPEDY